MISLSGLVTTAIVTLAIYLAVIGKKRAANPSRLLELSLVATSTLTLLLGLRFGARTYPGIWIPDSELLNSLLNGTTLFTIVGYGIALTAGAIRGSVLLFKAGGETSRRLQLTGNLLTALAAGVVVYGIIWAVALRRLPM